MNSKPPISLRDYFERVYLPMVLSSTVGHTQTKYRSSVRHADDFANRAVAISDLSDDFICSLSHHLTRGGMSKGMVCTHRQHLRSIAADAQHRGHKTGWISSIDPLANNVGGNRRQKFKRDTRGPKAKTARLLAKAAAMYANGFSLAEISARTGVPKETIHTWKTRFRACWDAAYEKATHIVVSSVRQEAKRRADLIKRSAYMQRATAADVALRKIDQTLAVDDGDADAGKSVTEFLVDLNITRAWGPLTFAQYRATLRRVERWSGRILYCRDFAPEWVNKFIAELDDSHLASATKTGVRTNLLAIWRAANDAGLCLCAPSKIRRVRVVQRPPSAWLYEEVQRAVATAAKAIGRYAITDPATGEEIDVARADVLRLVIRVLWDTGIRPGDAMRLKLSDVKDDGLIPLTQGKTGRWHVVKLHPSTLALSRSIPRSAKAHLIPWGKSYEHFRVEFAERVAQPSGLSGSFKMFRKSSATDVELHFPGMGAVHLGHRLTQNVAYSHYLDPRIAFKNRGMPTELTADLANQITACG